MIKLYDKNMKYIKSFTSYKDLKITEELKTGYKVAQFSVPYSIASIQEEQKIEINGYLYVIKEVNMEDEEFYSVYAKPYFSSLVNKSIDNYSRYGITFSEVMNSLLAETDWTFRGNALGAFTVNIQNKTLLEALSFVSELYNCYFIYQTKEKVIEVIDKNVDKDLKATFTITPSKLRSCQVQSNTYDLVTRLIPIGKDQITIQNVNGNCLYLDNHQYTDEIIVGYYVDGHCANADDLMITAKAKLDEISKPRTTYKIQISEFNTELKIGDKIRIINDIKKIDEELYIKKTVLFPETIEESYIELGAEMVSFDDIYKEFKDIQDSINKDTLRNLTELNKI